MKLLLQALQDKPLTIPEMQEAVKAAGYQWQEHVFNDGRANDCVLCISQSTDPLAFHLSPDAFANHYDHQQMIWGRYDRYTCWQRAYHVVLISTTQED